MEYTKESLQNTWGVVESKEHAEFIIEVAKNEGLKVWKPKVLKALDEVKTFEINRGTLCLLSISQGDLCTDGLKKITIPLPPKAKEWVPEVGDKVCWGLTREGVVKSLSDGFAWIKDSQDKQYKTVYVSSLTKPKSAQDLKIEELHAKLCEFTTVDNYILACDIVLGNIEGLSYK